MTTNGETYPLLSVDWDPDLGYKPMDPNCRDEHMDSFFSKEEEEICNRCPAKRAPFVNPPPIRAEQVTRSVADQAHVRSAW